MLLTGNIHDLFPVEIDGACRFVPLSTALRLTLTHAHYPRRGEDERFLVVTLRADGLRLGGEEDSAELKQFVAALSARVDEPEVLTLAAPFQAASQPAEPMTARQGLTALGNQLRSSARLRQRGIPFRPVAAIVEHADALFPNREMSALS